MHAKVKRYFGEKRGGIMKFSTANMGGCKIHCILKGDHVNAPSWQQKSSALSPPPPPPPTHTHKAINNYEYPEHVNKLCRRVLVITSLLANLIGKYVLPFTRKNIFVFQTEGGC